MLKTKYEEANIALFVDGPNMLRKEFSIDLRELRKRVSRYGRIVIAKVFVNQFAPEKLIEAIINEGFEAKIVLASKEEENDVDVSLAVEAIEAILTKDIHILALSTRDADFLPLIQKAKEYGKKVIIFGAEPGFSASLRNSADVVEILA
ncbi:MAG: TIGR00288 family NYN domain-containing protein [Candidatus Aenigmarchaeota archaeon]|nr:TIGR00288 family NYN domain-containing protein [Candidatus Aenigmarchaeota archaeon]MDW8160319.1 TIGR00288 family NYN domain-containing protein [Candidatus Aenigmarchaeota archaeon]